MNQRWQELYWTMYCTMLCVTVWHVTQRPPQTYSVCAPVSSVMFIPVRQTGKHINALIYHEATAPVLLTDCWCHAVPDDRSLLGTGWPLTGRTVCVSIVSSPCLQDQRTSWAPAVSTIVCWTHAHCTGMPLFSDETVWLLQEKRDKISHLGYTLLACILTEQFKKSLSGDFSNCPLKE